jgi:outer membrane lipoprotein-sorting protein
MHDVSVHRGNQKKKYESYLQVHNPNNFYMFYHPIHTARMMIISADKAVMMDSVNAL